MKPGRFSSVMTWVILLNHLLVATAFAGFGFGGNDLGKSGLDFAKGYDVNTVTTVSGRVASPPQTGEKEQIFVEIKVGGETINLSLGPKSFWEKQGFRLRLNDDVTAKGAKAEGKDGKTYLITQKLINKTTSAQVVLRNDKGSPSWLGTMSNRPDGSMGNQGGGIMRDGGMMRGGGGMMRR
jgi:hypothetical protein